jgi:hypothetical protein
MSRISITCSGCGQLLSLDSDDPRAEIECLWCGARTRVVASKASSEAVRAETPPRRARPPEPPPREPAARVAPAQPIEEAFASTPLPGLSPPAASPPPSKREAGDGYQFAGPPERPCPGCDRALAADVVVCPSCGFDQETGTRKRRTYEPVRRNWEAGWPLSRRLVLFLTGQALALPLSLLGAWALGGWGGFVGSWLVFTALTAFLLGTYARTDLIRSESGKVRLIQTWRVCFVAQSSQAIRRSEYEGVVSGKGRAADFWDWFVQVILLILGIVPGVLWWYFVIRPDTYFVALTRDHGFPERTLYWGWDERQAQDMARTLNKIAFGTT